MNRKTLKFARAYGFRGDPPPDDPTDDDDDDGE